MFSILGRVGYPSILLQRTHSGVHLDEDHLSATCAVASASLVFTYYAQLTARINSRTNIGRSGSGHEPSKAQGRDRATARLGVGMYTRLNALGLNLIVRGTVPVGLMYTMVCIHPTCARSFLLGRWLCYALGCTAPLGRARPMLQRLSGSCGDTQPH